MIETVKALQSAVEKILPELRREGKTEEEVWEFVSDKYQEAMDLKDQMLEFGYNEGEAYLAASQKLANSVKNQSIDGLYYGKIIPLRVIREYLEGEPNWHDLSDKQRATILWELGFNTKTYNWFINAGCIRYGKRVECGVFIQGAERLDKEWLTMKVNDKSVASIEARFHKDQDTLSVLKGYRAA